MEQLIELDTLVRTFLWGGPWYQDAIVGFVFLVIWCILCILFAWVKSAQQADEARKHGYTEDEIRQHLGDTDNPVKWLKGEVDYERRK